MSQQQVCHSEFQGSTQRDSLRCASSQPAHSTNDLPKKAAKKRQRDGSQLLTKRNMEAVSKLIFCQNKNWNRSNLKKALIPIPMLFFPDTLLPSRRKVSITIKTKRCSNRCETRSPIRSRLKDRMEPGETGPSELTIERTSRMARVCSELVDLNVTSERLINFDNPGSLSATKTVV